MTAEPWAAIGDLAKHPSTSVLRRIPSARWSENCGLPSLRCRSRRPARPRAGSARRPRRCGRAQERCPEGDTRQALRAVSEELKAADIVGLDVEAALAYGRLCLLQFAARTRTFLIDPLAVGDLKPIVDVLGGATPLKFIHYVRFERRILVAMRIVLDGVFEALEAKRRFYRTASAGIWA